MNLSIFNLLIALTSAKQQRSDSECLQKSRVLYPLMTTVTIYDHVAGRLQEIPGCRPESLWMFVRHASRYSPLDEMARLYDLRHLRDEIVELHNKSKGELCDEDVDALARWVLNEEPSQNMSLTPSGIQEHRRQARRLYRHFGHLLWENSTKGVQVGITHFERSRQTGEAFMSGLWERDVKIDDSKLFDELLVNDENCTAWDPSMHNRHLVEETAKFRNSPEVKQMLKDVSRRLGLDYQLNFDKVKDIYDACTLEYSWYLDKHATPWCAALSNEDLRLMEYNEDLTYFYQSAYGNNLTIKCGCAFVRDITEKLSAGSPGATLYFGHSLGVRKILTGLGIGADIFLSGHHYQSSGDRLWRNSILTPFGANLIAVRYLCEQGSHGIWDRTRVAIFLNEKLVPLPGCGNRHMCGLEEFKRVYEPITNPGFCNRDFCNNP